MFSLRLHRGDIIMRYYKVCFNLRTPYIVSKNFKLAFLAEDKYEALNKFQKYELISGLEFNAGFPKLLTGKELVITKESFKKISPMRCINCGERVGNGGSFGYVVELTSAGKESSKPHAKFCYKCESISMTGY